MPFVWSSDPGVQLEALVQSFSLDPNLPYVRCEHGRQRNLWLQTDQGLLGPNEERDPWYVGTRKRPSPRKATAAPRSGPPKSVPPAVRGTPQREDSAEKEADKAAEKPAPANATASKTAPPKPAEKPEKKVEEKREPVKAAATETAAPKPAEKAEPSSADKASEQVIVLISYACWMLCSGNVNWSRQDSKQD